MGAPICYGDGIYCIDSGYVRPGLAAIYLLIDSGRAAIIETGCNRSVPLVVSALEELGIEPTCVDYVIPTHVHLDHAGGAGSMMQVFSRAQLIVHPRGARHMANPSKLIAGTIGVYGAEATSHLYGEILPIDSERIVEARDGLSIQLGTRTLTCLDVPGHAKHHIVVVDGKTGHIFTGDVFGVSYSELNGKDQQFVFPTTTPVQFDPEALHLSMDRLLALHPAAVYLTHFGQLHNVERNGAALHRHIDAFVAIARDARGSGSERHRQIHDGLVRYALAEVRAVGCNLLEAEILTLLANDIELNAQGLGVWLDTQAAAN